MPYVDGMAADRLRVTVPSELGAALRALAAARGATISTVVADAIAHQVRTAALDLALVGADQRFGAIDDAAVVKAKVDLVKAARRGAKLRSRGRSR